MDFKLSVTRHRPVYALLGTLLLSAVLVLGIALEYAYDASSRIAAAAGFAVLLVTLAGTWRITRATRNDAAPTPLDAMTRLGLLLGMLWVIEIGINNVIAPPLPGRDTIDDLFWGLIALGVLAASVASAFRSGRLRGDRCRRLDRLRQRRGGLRDGAGPGRFWHVAAAERPGPISPSGRTGRRNPPRPPSTPTSPTRPWPARSSTSSSQGW